MKADNVTTRKRVRRVDECYANGRDIVAERPTWELSVSGIGNIVNINIPLVKNSDWEQWFFLVSDHHFDSTHCERDELRRDYELALKRKAIILCAGDWFDAMQGHRDPRGSKSEIRPEYKKSDYWSAVVDDSVLFLDRYAKNIGFMSYGNHETSVLKNSEIDILRQLVVRLNESTRSKIHLGKYEEFIRLSFIPPRGTKERDCKHSKMIYVHHGFGGASPVTGGVIDNARTAEFVRADIVWMGHTHTQYLDNRAYWQTTTHDTILEKNTVFVRTPGYKKARMPGMTTWETVKGIKPKPRGGQWLRFYWGRYSGEDAGIQCEAVTHI